MSIIQGTAKGGSTGEFYDYPIGDSFRFDGTSSYLSRTPSTAGNRKTWTWSGWVKRGNIGLERGIFSVGASAANFALFFHSSDQLRIWTNNGNASIYTNAVYRDLSAWYHIVLQSSNVSPYFNLYVNGEKITSFSLDGRATYPSTNDTEVNSIDTHRLGAWYNGALQTFNGYLANIQFIDGQALDASYFGETKDDIWIPKTFDGTSSTGGSTVSTDYGTNGFLLDFSSISGTTINDTAPIDTNHSSANNWTATGF